MESKFQMSDEAREARNHYQREWKQRNPDKVKGANVRFWEKKATSIPIEERAYQLHRQGYSLREIADQLHVSHMTVSRYLKQYE